jgi:hypothetical protein
MSLAPESWSVSAVTAETARGTSERPMLLRVAVTMISGGALAASSAAAAAGGVVVAGLSCAAAGAAKARSPVEINQIDFVTVLPLSFATFWGFGFG